MVASNKLYYKMQFLKTTPFPQYKVTSVHVYKCLCGQNKHFTLMQGKKKESKQ